MKMFYLINRISADVDIDSNFILESLTVVMDPLRFISTEVQNHIKLVSISDDLH